MAYLRWGYSNWYIFWHVSDAKQKEDELLAIWHVSDEGLPCFTYEELQDVDSIEDLRRLIGLDLSDEEYQECLECVKAFVADVDENYAKEGGN